MGFLGGRGFGFLGERLERITEIWLRANENGVRLFIDVSLYKDDQINPPTSLLWPLRDILV